MRRKAKIVVKVALTIVLVVGMVLSANVRVVSHDLSELTQLVAEHDAGIEEHGHAHDDAVDLIDAYHGHSHDVADHDHNIAFLPPRTPSITVLPTGSTWALANNVFEDHSDFGLERPPRV